MTGDPCPCCGCCDNIVYTDDRGVIHKVCRGCEHEWKFE